MLLAVATYIMVAAAPDGQRGYVVQDVPKLETRRFELTLFPVVFPINDTYARHFGTAARVYFHINRFIGLQVSGTYNWYRSESDFNNQLANSMNAEVEAAKSSLLVGAITGGVEVTPIAGKFALFNRAIVNFRFFVSGGVGVLWASHQLKAGSGANSPATFGDLGTQFMGQVGGGFRVGVGDRFAIRLEVMDMISNVKVSSINGCGLDDLKNLRENYLAGKSLSSATVSQGCAASGVPSFSGRDAQGRLRADDIPLAFNLVNQQNSSINHYVGFYLGASVVF